MGLVEAHEHVARLHVVALADHQGADHAAGRVLDLLHVRLDHQLPRRDHRPGDLGEGGPAADATMRISDRAVARARWRAMAGRASPGSGARVGRGRAGTARVGKAGAWGCITRSPAWPAWRWGSRVRTAAGTAPRRAVGGGHRVMPPGSAGGCAAGLPPSARGRHPPLGHRENQVDGGQRRGSVGNHHTDAPTLSNAGDGPGQGVLAIGVEVRVRLVEHHEETDRRTGRGRGRCAGAARRRAPRRPRRAPCRSRRAGAG